MRLRGGKSCHRDEASSLGHPDPFIFSFDLDCFLSDPSSAGFLLSFFPFPSPFVLFSFVWDHASRTPSRTRQARVGAQSRQACGECIRACSQESDTHVDLFSLRESPRRAIRAFTSLFQASVVCSYVLCKPSFFPTTPRQSTSLQLPSMKPTLLHTSLS